MIQIMGAQETASKHLNTVRQGSLSVLCVRERVCCAKILFLYTVLLYCLVLNGSLSTPLSCGEPNAVTAAGNKQATALDRLAVAERLCSRMLNT